MIYIRKSEPSQAIRRHLAELKSEPEWKKLSNDDVEGIRIYFDRVNKNLIRDEIYRDQHGLCAYCMRRIKNDSSMKIEHWLPLSRSKNEALNYNNFLGACDGGTKVADNNKYLTCDVSKANKAVMVNPLSKKQMDKIIYCVNGMIKTKPHDENMEFDINNVLHLNGYLDEDGELLHDTSTRLVKSRRDVYNLYSYLMIALDKKYKGNETKMKNFIKKKIAELENADIYEEFLGVWLYFLKRRIR